ncbi:heterokaryon incompatibility protein-domain-containing protein [Xylaria flabelliformis]|nr:heterokaryon incompatibility protein-domain-containing protein [Xylaria flabelliformis]
MMATCDNCKAFVPVVQRNFIPRSSPRGNTMSINLGTTSQVLKSSSSCAGCAFFKSVMDNQGFTYEPHGQIRILYPQVEFRDGKDKFYRLRPFSEINLWLPAIERKDLINGKGSSLVSIHAYSNEDSNLSQTMVVGGRQIRPANDSRVARLWLSDCLRNHPNCLLRGVVESIESTNHTLPTRLIDVGDDENPNFCRLVEGKTAKGPYSALTYCWGNGAILKTRMSTLYTHRVCIDWTEMNQTYRDAIEATRALGIRYIWIDALCIIQGDREDWEREAANMASVYQNAIITLSAAQGTSADEGLFLRRSTFTSTHFLGGPEPTDGLYLSEQLYGAKRFYDDVQVGPLSQRGWTLQERILSRRLLHFGTDQLHWECQSTVASEKNPFAAAEGVRPGIDPATVFRSRQVYGRMGLGDLVDDNNNTRKMFSRYGSQSSAHVQATISAWQTLVCAYSKRAITNPGDKLPAIAGLINAFEERFDAKIIWGLNIADKTGALIWSVKHGTRALVERAPSWSWIAVDGEVKFWILRNDIAHLAAGGIQFTDRVCSFTTKVKPVALQKPSAQEMSILECNIRIGDGTVNKIGYGVLDTDPQANTDGDSLHASNLHDNFAALVTYADEDRARYSFEPPGPSAFCLLLKRHTDKAESEYYQRLGIANITTDYFVEGAKTSIIKLL